MVAVDAASAEMDLQSPPTPSTPFHDPDPKGEVPAAPAHLVPCISSPIPKAPSSGLAL